MTDESNERYDPVVRSALDVMAQVRHLEAEVERLTAENERLRARLAALEGDDTESPA